MYTERNFKTKKALKEALKNGEKIRVYQLNDFFKANTKEGQCFLEGSHYPEPHTWYAEGVLKDGILIKIR